MNAGSLRHRVTLQTLSAGRDEIGQPLTTWTDTALLWADIRYHSGLSTIKSGADTSIAKVSIRVRHGTFNAGQRVLNGNEVFAIDSVFPDSKKSYVDLVCRVINADA